MDKSVLLYYRVFMSESLVLLDPHHARCILRGPDSQAAFPKNLVFLKLFLGDGLITLNGSDWSRHRKILQPAFEKRHVVSLLEQHVPRSMDQLCRAWEALPDRTPFILHDHLGSVTLDLIGRMGFGHDFGTVAALVRWSEAVRRFAAEKRRSSSSNGGENNGRSDAPLGPLRSKELPAVEALSDDPIMSAISPKNFHRLVRPSVLELMFGDAWTGFTSRFVPGSQGWDRAAATRGMDRCIDRIIEEQRERCAKSDKELEASFSKRRRSSNLSADGDGESNARSVRRSTLRAPRSILELLLSEHAGLSDEELRNECKTFVLAGAETTSTAVNFAVFAMCTEPGGEDAQRRLFEEVRSHWPDASAPLTAEIVNGMEYIDCVLREAMRLFPPVGMIVRNSAGGVKVELDGVTVPPGTRTVLSIFLLHRNERIWGKRAGEFLPQRWIRGEAKAEVIDPPPDDPYAYLPFLAGGRQCIGKNFAMLEAKMILATMVRKFRFRLAEEQRGVKFDLTAMVTLSSRPQFMAEVEGRSD